MSKRINKKNYKHIKKKCALCDETCYATFSVHRIFEGHKGGKYVAENVLNVCENCHRKIHNKIIQILGVYDSTMGKVVNIIKEDGKEDFIPI